MLMNIITVNSTLGVVWYWSHDTSEKAPKKLHDLVNGVCLVGGLVTLPLDVTGSDVWVLTRRTATGYCVLTRYYRDGRKQEAGRLPDGIEAAFNPIEGMAANVWARAVAEAHDLVCKGRQGGCDCTDARRQLDKSGLLA